MTPNYDPACSRDENRQGMHLASSTFDWAREETFMKRVTRDIDPVDAQDLLERVPRACLAFAYDHGPYAQPIAFVWLDGRYLAGIPETTNLQPAVDQEVVLLVDEGVYFFDLRAIYIRGRVKPAETPNGALAGRTWFEVLPLKTVAWDYGTLREVKDES
jgi:nitroimidazol reductase NimA-like FMN-containing flavoprotein (pyridoxamine 5'-phosphate oxidase superfamily)